MLKKRFVTACLALVFACVIYRVIIVAHVMLLLPSFIEKAVLV